MIGFVGDNFSGFLGSGKRAGIDGVPGLIGEVLGTGFCLRASGVIERDVFSSLKSAC